MFLWSDEVFIMKTQHLISIIESSRIVLARSGTSAVLISKHRPECPIYGITRFARAANQMKLHHGIHPIFYDQPKDPKWEVDIENRVQYCFKCVIQRGYVQPGSLAVVVTGW